MARGVEAKMGLSAWDLEADVVVLGFGAAGIGAATAAAKAGCSVIVVEKMGAADAGGGLSCNSGGLVLNSAEFTRFGSYNRFSETFSEELAAREAQVCDWIRLIHSGMGRIEFAGTTIYTEPAGGCAIYRDVARHVAGLPGVRIEYRLAAQRLVTDPDTGEVQGVVALRDGDKVAIKGRLATIVATGGFAADTEFMGSAYGMCLPYVTSGSPAATGDGIKMALSAGAKMSRLAQSCEFYNPALAVISRKLGTAVQLQSNAIDGCIYVNVDGKRFCNERDSMTHNKGSLPMLDICGRGLLVQPDTEIGYRNLPAWAVWDSVMFGGDPIVEQSNLSWARAHSGYEWGRDNRAHGEEDGILSAATLRELAAKMKSSDIWGQTVSVDAEGLIATVERYNDSVGSGKDGEFGREPSSMTGRVATLPFYAAEIVPNVMFTINGLETDEISRVLDWGDKPIPRLFAAGDIAQGSVLTTIGILGCIARGQIAGEQASQLASWEE